MGLSAEDVARMPDSEEVLSRHGVAPSLQLPACRKAEIPPGETVPGNLLQADWSKCWVEGSELKGIGAENEGMLKLNAEDPILR